MRSANVVFRVCRRLLAAALLSVAALPAVAAELPDPAALRARLAAGEHARVFAELAPLEFEFAGQPQYDYLFAVAALRSGEVNLAAFVLERVVAVAPSHIGAAFELAQTDILLGKTEQGLAALRKLVVRPDVPPGQKRMIAGRILGVEAAIAARAREAHQRQFGLHGALSVGGGYTDNARFAPDGSDVVLSVAPGIELVATGEEPASSAYAETAANLEYRIPRGESGRMAFGFKVFSRGYESAADANDSNYHAWGPYFSAGAALGPVRLDGRISAERVAVSDAPRHDFYGADLGGLIPLGKTTALRGALGYRFLRGRADEVDDKHARQASVALLYAPKRDVLLRLQTGFADEERKDEDDSDGDKLTNSAQAAATIGLTAAADLTALAAFRKSRYERPLDVPPNYGARRRDYTTTAVLSLVWKITGGVSIVPEAIYTKARSNIRDHEYIRRELRFGVRYEF